MGLGGVIQGAVHLPLAVAATLYHHCCYDERKDDEPGASRTQVPGLVLVLVRVLVLVLVAAVAFSSASRACPACRVYRACGGQRSGRGCLGLLPLPLPLPVLAVLPVVLQVVGPLRRYRHEEGSPGEAGPLWMWMQALYPELLPKIRPMIQPTSPCWCRL